MAYTVTVQDIHSVTDVEAAFSTMRLLPPESEIPGAFYKGNIYTALMEALFHGNTLPDADIELEKGLESEKLDKCVRAHLQSFGPKHEHKIAGVAYMLSKVAVITARSGA